MIADFFRRVGKAGRAFASQTGSRASSYLRHIGACASLLAMTTRCLFARPFFFSNLVAQMAKVGVESLPVVAVNGAFIGMVLALQGYEQLKMLGTEGLLGSFVSTAAIKELGVMLTAFVLSGRIGASITAELGSMKVTEQIDAIEAMGANPVQYLVVPRFIACLLMLPVLAVFANMIVVVGGYFFATSVLSGAGGASGVSGEHFWDMVQSSRSFMVKDVYTSLFKGATFGVIIATIGCYMGFSAPAASGAEGVGRATTSSAVTSLVLILIADFLIEYVSGQVLDI